MRDLGQDERVGQTPCPTPDRRGPWHPEIAPTCTHGASEHALYSYLVPRRSDCTYSYEICAYLIASTTVYLLTVAVYLFLQHHCQIHYCPGDNTNERKAVPCANQIQPSQKLVPVHAPKRVGVQRYRLPEGTACGNWQCCVCAEYTKIVQASWCV